MKVVGMEFCSVATQEFYEYGYISNMIAFATFMTLLNKVSQKLEDRLGYCALLVKKY